MRSLRSRLVLGSALVAVVPLAVAMLLISQRVSRTVRAEADQRLASTLGALRTRLAADGERIGEQLRILGGDLALKRLYLVRGAGSRELSDFLVERQFLLGLDFLEVADSSRRVIAEGTPAPAPGTVPVLSASAPIRYEGATVGTVRGGRLLDARFLDALKRASGVELALRGPDGRVVASTLPGLDARALAAAAVSGRVPLEGHTWFARGFELPLGSRGTMSVTGLVSTAAAEQTNATLRITAILLGLAGAAVAIVLGLLWSGQVSRPVERLAAFSHRVAQGDWNEPLALPSVRELQTLVGALDRMRADLRGYRERLLTSERQAAWGQMARTVAHEIKNPLTPIAISIADLRRSFEQQREDFPAILEQAARTIGDEIETLKHLLQEFSDFGRLPAPRFAPLRVSELLADIETLYAREIAAGRLEVARPPAEITLAADAGQLRQALVNLIKNGLEATGAPAEGAPGSGGRVTLAARALERELEIAVSDTGPGLTAERRAAPFAPGLTTKAQGSGLGLTVVERVVSDHGGTIAVESEPARGTTFRMRLPLARET